MNEEWGPWIEHDGEGCPVQIGSVVHVILNDPTARPTSTDGLIAIGSGWAIFRITEPAHPGGSWFWGFDYAWIIRYRIRKPLGLTILERLLEHLPDQVDA